MCTYEVVVLVLCMVSCESPHADDEQTTGVLLELLWRTEWASALEEVTVIHIR